MAKHKTREEGITLFKEYESKRQIPSEYFSNLSLKETSESNARKKRNRSMTKKVTQAIFRFKNKYKQGKMLDNAFMEQKVETRGRKKKGNIDDVISDLTEKEKDDIVRRYLEKTIEENKQKRKKEACSFSGSFLKKAAVFDLHRTTFYKQSKKRIYKFDFAKELIKKEFFKSKEIYGSKRLSIILSKQGICISDRTLRNYMARGGLITKTRKARKRTEIKNTKVMYKDLVSRNFNPKEDSIIATDVSYIPANETQNHIYLSIAISHKTKAIESYSLSRTNGNSLVVDTIKQLKRNNFIFHSDHGFQYSSNIVIEQLHKINGITSMGRVGNSLDNREAEYFFGCLKGEYLNHVPTHRMKLEEISQHIEGYVNGYNTNRIQKRLQGKTPTEVSAYAI